jgi:D-alanyl-D-alanine dipeptidase
MKQMFRRSRPWLCVLWFSLLTVVSFAQSAPFGFPGNKPPDTPQAWKRLIGEYGSEASSLLVLEKSGNLILRQRDNVETVLQPASGANFTMGDTAGRPISVHFDSTGKERAASISLGDALFPRHKLGPDEGLPFQIQPSRPVDDLRKEALAATPPHEEGNFRQPDLVELAPLEPAIHLDIRYATSNDFLGTPVYTRARAFLQRPAAEALLRALHRLKPFGYALLIHDAYRPWYVTKIFWDATPPEGKIFVADPAQGSRHNRGCAVDLTLYDLKSGQPIEMTGTYDEMSPRSFPDYPGGTSLQRWHRDLLRWAMESEGFTVYDHEWWHFDFKDWHAYPILNVPFEN